jgi:hypothetical protein
MGSNTFLYRRPSSILVRRVSANCELQCVKRVDLTCGFINTLFATEAIADAGASTASVVFEPVLDVQALSTFLVISIVFTALIVRTNQVEGGVQERNRALAKLREVKSKELAGDETVDEGVIQLALSEYEDAVRKEEKLRTIIPGVVRIVPPSSANKKEEDARAIAQQFLGKDFEIGTSKREEVENRNVPTLALVAVLALFILQGALFFAAANDLMASSSIRGEM